MKTLLILLVLPTFSYAVETTKEKTTCTVRQEECNRLTSRYKAKLCFIDKASVQKDKNGYYLISQECEGMRQVVLGSEGEDPTSKINSVLNDESDACRLVSEIKWIGFNEIKPNISNACMISQDLKITFESNRPGTHQGFSSDCFDKEQMIALSSAFGKSNTTVISSPNSANGIVLHDGSKILQPVQLKLSIQNKKNEKWESTGGMFSDNQFKETTTVAQSCKNICNQLKEKITAYSSSLQWCVQQRDPPLWNSLNNSNSYLSCEGWNDHTQKMLDEVLAKYDALKKATVDCGSSAASDAREKIPNLKPSENIKSISNPDKESDSAI